jgi:hypothetical protein
MITIICSVSIATFCHMLQRIFQVFLQMTAKVDPKIFLGVAEPPELFQFKCLSHALEATTHLNRNNPSVFQI